MSYTFSSVIPKFEFKIPEYEMFGITVDQRLDLAKAVALRLYSTSLSKRSVRTLFRNIETVHHDQYEIAHYGAKQGNLSFVEELALHIDICLNDQAHNVRRLRDDNGDAISVYGFFYLSTPNRSDYLPLEILFEPIWPLKDSTWKTILESDFGFGWKSVFPLIVIGSLADITDIPCPKIKTTQSRPKPEEPKKPIQEQPAPEQPTTSDTSRPKRPKDLFAEAADNLQEKTSVLNRFIDRLQEIGQSDELRGNLITLMNPENRAFQIYPDYYDAAEENLKRNGVSDGIIHRVLELSSNEEMRKNILTIITPDPNWIYSQ